VADERVPLESPAVAKAATQWGDKVTFIGAPGQARTTGMKPTATPAWTAPLMPSTPTAL
jgi:hypothetical protein